MIPSATTTILVGMIAILLVVQLLAYALFLQWGSRWARIPNVGFGRAVATIVVAQLVGIIPIVLAYLAPQRTRGQAIFVVILLVVLTFGLTWSVMARMLRTSVWRAIVAWLATLIPAVGFALLPIFVINPYIFEAFKVPTNSMAPTILGKHWEVPCPRCGSPAYCTPEPEWPNEMDRPVLMICSRELRPCEVVRPSHVKHSGDRFVVAKFLHPQRWDLIVFRLPEDPEMVFVKRLVGLPGETVTIKEGAVWINGKRQALPDACKGIEYLDHIKEVPHVFWGSAARPAILGPDEYYVLGDFSACSKDSRLWIEGAPGHPPYAVPASYIVGVVTHIYWPLSRCRTLR